jgi:hypothetical protein
MDKIMPGNILSLLNLPYHVFAEILYKPQHDFLSIQYHDRYYEYVCYRGGARGNRFMCLSHMFMDPLLSTGFSA